MSLNYGQPNYGAPAKPKKSWMVTLLLSIFLGGLGIDRFYLGHIGLGVAKLLLGWATFGIWWLIDLIFIAMRKVDTTNFEWDDEQPMQQYPQQYQAPQPPYQQ